jgi:glycerol-3-phosphate dehydrogenase (NAD(P)+)
MSKISVIGAGKWGSALAYALSFKKDVSITSRTPRDLPNFIDLETALQSKYLIVSIATQEIRNWLKENYTFNKALNQKVLVASKGIEASTGKFLQEIYEEYIPRENLGFISGPSFASEVQQGLPTALVINTLDEKFYNEFASFFPDFIKTYHSTDIIGAEIAGAYKNVLAIASGICEGLELGNNARASLISRGLVEMTRFGKIYNAQDETFLGLSGAGDLFLTASSTLSRNFRVGIGLAHNKSLPTILEELGEVAEGVKTAEAIYKISQEKEIYTPIATEVQLILDGKNPQQSLKDLLKN